MGLDTCVASNGKSHVLSIEQLTTDRRYKTPVDVPLKHAKMTPDSSISPGNVKKIRRRLRLSCIECTKRRQRCDRIQPACGLCKSRGIEHLCRWASVPFARPAPAKTPALVKANESDELKIQRLLNRVDALERQLEQQCTRAEDRPYYRVVQCSSTSSSPVLDSKISSSCLPFDSPAYLPEFGYRKGTRDLKPSRKFNFSPSILHSIACSLALPLSFQEELIGRGSSVYTLLQMAKSHAPDIDCWVQKRYPCCSIFMQSNLGQGVTHISSLVQKLPPPLETERLLSAYFEYSNWYFGLPETWIRTVVSQMWDFLHCPAPDNTHLNSNWLCLFFAILASVPPNIAITNHQYDDEQFTAYSLAALRLTGDMHQHTFEQTTSDMEGIVLACVAVPLLSKRRAASGRLNEAWKLLGNWIRVALSLELHLEPEYEHWLDHEKQALRRLAWTNLAICDRFYSLLLSRPSMNFNKFLDVTNYSDTPFPTYLDVLYELSLLAEDINKLVPVFHLSSSAMCANTRPSNSISDATSSMTSGSRLSISDCVNVLQTWTTLARRLTSTMSQVWQRDSLSFLGTCF
ncbi:hypothetical protein J3R30DRAFT_1821410 [Lentinula aciculospora]|uniref:Zn(2)-C6 fungal-type domain-containing protein n=1 Tax=Lentinula aciculospora TaxID=153920 RepID=A0A9W9AIQ3_9AGAR|nr:hypothetical protein J3R30DRAFT_1821410 [Lentinula aciculospora]